MKLDQQFKEFLTEIRLTASQREDYMNGIRVLRARLAADADLSPVIVSTFLQGSIRRATAVRPSNGKRADADLVVVTNLDKDGVTAREVLQRFERFAERWYPGKWEPQGRSIGITLSHVEMDIVPTALPGDEETVSRYKWASVTTAESIEEAPDWRLNKAWLPEEKRDPVLRKSLEALAAVQDEWKANPIWIPDREVNDWEKTHPLAQIAWTVEKNRRCNRHYVNVVKAVKWMRQNDDRMPKYPKGYPVEHLVGVSCPDGITSVAEGLTLTLEHIASEYAWHAEQGITPRLCDHGVPEHNVMARVDGKDFAAFHGRITTMAQAARRALDSQDAQESAELWRELLGSKFPKPPTNGGDRSGFTPRATVSTTAGPAPRFA